MLLCHIFLVIWISWIKRSVFNSHFFASYERYMGKKCRTYFILIEGYEYVMEKHQMLYKRLLIFLLYKKLVDIYFQIKIIKKNV